MNEKRYPLPHFSNSNQSNNPGFSLFPKRKINMKEGTVSMRSWFVSAVDKEEMKLQQPEWIMDGGKQQ